MNQRASVTELFTEGELGVLARARGDRRYVPPMDYDLIDALSYVFKQKQTWWSFPFGGFDPGSMKGDWGFNKPGIIDDYIPSFDFASPSPSPTQKIVTAKLKLTELIKQYMPKPLGNLSIDPALYLEANTPGPPFVYAPPTVAELSDAAKKAHAAFNDHLKHQFAKKKGGNS